MAELYWGDKKVIGIKPPGGEYISISSTGKKILKGWNIVYDGTVTEDVYMGDFYGNKALVSLTMPDNITSIYVPHGMPDGLFYECTSLKYIKLSNALTVLPEDMFMNLPLSELELPRSLTTIGGMCFSRSKLKSIVFPSNVNSIYYRAFANCSDLKSVYFEGDPPSDIDDYAFYGCSFTAYHKSNNSNWTDEIKISTYGGATNVIWSTY